MRRVRMTIKQHCPECGSGVWADDGKGVKARMAQHMKESHPAKKATKKK